VTTKWRRFRSLSSRDRRLVLEAALLLSIVRIGLRIFTFRRLRQLLSWYAPHVDPADSQQATRASHPPGRVTWAVSAAARNRESPVTCLVKALATDTMLRRQGITSQLRFGVRSGGEGARPLTAHAWVECDGIVVFGEINELPTYSVLSPSGSSDFLSP
jgi:hypothetical protein